MFLDQCIQLSIYASAAGWITYEAEESDPLRFMLNDRLTSVGFGALRTIRFPRP